MAGLLSNGLMHAIRSRRQFLKQTAMAGATAALSGWSLNSRAADSPNKKLVVGVMGLSRGYDHIQALLKIPNVEIAYVCDVDQVRLDRGAKAVADASAKPARAVKDFRSILEDKAVDALFIAAPSFWHAPATILACAAGKHVYVEKPGSHNAREAELIVQAARKHRRLVQLGTQRRSWPAIMEGMEKLRSGIIGTVTSARCYYTNQRGSIGRGRSVAPPANLDYDLWQGPVPERPYVDNLVHYNWHWRWHWGGGELANNGVHALDLALWGLGQTAAVRVTYNGGRYCFQDDQETPDTGMAVFDCGRSVIMFDHSSCHPRRGEPAPLVAFYGSEGTWVQESNGYRIFDPRGKEIDKGAGTGGDKVHIENFVEAIRSGGSLNAEIEVGQQSAMLCHLGNMAYRTSGAVRFDAASHRVVGNSDAAKLWAREYRRGWEPKV